MYLFSVSLFLLVDSNGVKVDIIHPAFIGAVFPAVLAFYTFYFKLFDQYLSKREITHLVLAVLVVVLITPVLTETLLYMIYIGRLHWDRQMVFFGGLIISLVSLISGILGLVMKGFITWYNEIKIKLDLNEKNYQMELSLMKAQLNPHFLFNTINNIDGLIQDGSGKASEYLNKLSDIMRFMLYDAKKEKIPLVKEISYIEKYIELQKIRTTNPKYVKYEIEGNPENILIESMLFIPFMENAFKHSENKRVENAIQIQFLIQKDKISFKCENAYSTDVQSKPEYGGLGNELIQRRLVLLYPNKHTLEVTDINGIYRVYLLILL